MFKAISKMALIGCCLSASVLFAARAINLSGKNLDYIATFSKTLAANNNPNQLQVVDEQVDFNQTRHTRLKQTYRGYPVLGGEARIHRQAFSAGFSPLSNQVNPISMNGVIYEALDADLNNAPSYIFSEVNANKVLTQTLTDFQKRTGAGLTILNKKNELLVFVDDKNKAHWAYHVRFYGKQNQFPMAPHYLIDAITGEQFYAWDEVLSLRNAKAGGYGGNPTMGKLIYDGQKGHLDALQIERDTQQKTCYLQNANVIVHDFRTMHVVQFPCEHFDSKHNRIYWQTATDAINGGFSPNNDALFAGTKIHEMYQTWYGFSVLMQDKKPQRLEMYTHSDNAKINNGVPLPDNAYWDCEEEKMYFGDGKLYYYPLTSAGIAAHEISHGFTQQHSKLWPIMEPGGINESFSDMAAQAVEYFLNGKSSWRIGAEVTKRKGTALRYLDFPTKDCHGKAPGDHCSIDHVKDYTHKLDSHFTSGIFNRVFYLIATAPDWNVKKAFDIMVQANQYYWPELPHFIEAACGVIAATKDYKYDLTAVHAAFTKVGIDTSKC